MLSMDPVQLRSTRVGPTAVADRPLGLVGTWVSVPWLIDVTTSCGRCAAVPSFAVTCKASAEVPISTKLVVPFPVTSGVTSYSTQPPEVICPLSSVAPLVGAGLLFHVIAVSALVQLVL